MRAVAVVVALVFGLGCATPESRRTGLVLGGAMVVVGGATLAYQSGNEPECTDSHSDQLCGTDHALGMTASLALLVTGAIVIAVAALSKPAPAQN